MNNFHDLQKKANSTGFSEILKNSNAAFAHRVLQLRRCGIKKKTKTEKRAQEMEGRAKTQQTTNKVCVGRKAALGLRHIAGLMPPSVSTRKASGTVMSAIRLRHTLSTLAAMFALNKMIAAAEEKRK